MKTRKEPAAAAAKTRRNTKSQPDGFSGVFVRDRARVPDDNPIDTAFAERQQKCPPAGPDAKVPTKADLLIGMLTRPEGATVAAMAEASGWMTHSVRGFMAGTLRKRTGKAVTSEKTDAGRLYRLAPGDAA